MKTWWLSFCDPDLPEGSSFVGIILVDEINFKKAVKKSWKLKINPGGQVAGFDITGMYDIKPEYKNRLLNINEVTSIVGEVEKIGDAMERDDKSVNDLVCTECNRQHT